MRPATLGHMAIPDRWDLVVAHRERLVRLVRARLSDPGDVEDCVQEALLRTACFANLDEDRVGAFLTTTALRLCVDHYRGSERRRRLHLRAASVTAPPGPDEIACDRELGGRMLRHLRQLPERERDVLLARANGMSPAETAAALGISAKATESAFTRGRARLRRMFEQSEY